MASSRAPLHANGLAESNGALYVVDSAANAVYRIQGGAVQRLAGGNPAGATFANGTGCAATFNRPTGGAVVQGASGTRLFIADTGNQQIREVTISP